MTSEDPASERATLNRCGIVRVPATCFISEASYTNLGDAVAAAKRQEVGASDRAAPSSTALLMAFGPNTLILKMTRPPSRSMFEPVAANQMATDDHSQGRRGNRGDDKKHKHGQLLSSGGCGRTFG